MSAGAQLLGPVTPDGDDPHLLAVLLPEQGHGACSAGGVDVHDLVGDGQVLRQPVVDPLLNAGDLVRGQGGAMAEVEAHAGGRVLAAGLGGVVGDDLVERLVHHVGGGVGPGDRQAARRVDLGEGLLPHRDRALGQGATVDMQPLDGGLDVVDLDGAAVGQPDRALVGELAAHLGPERSPVQDDLDLGRGGDDALRDAVDEDPGDGGIGGGLGVAQEGRAPAHLLLQLAEDADVGVSGLLGARVGPSALLLLVHEAAEGALIDIDPLLGRHLQGQVDGEAVGVVQLEGALARHQRAPGAARLLLGRGHRGVQDRGAGGQGAAEGVLLAVGHLGDGAPAGLQLGVGGLHGVLRDGQQGGHGGLVDAEQAHGAHRPADEAAQDVAAAVVAGTHAVGDEHEGRAHVVGDDPHAHVIVVGLARLGAGRAAAVDLSGQLLGGLDDGEDLVDLVHVGLVLHDEGQALQTGTGIDGRLVELAQELEVVALALSAQELVEDEVPDLQEAVALGVDGGTAVGPVGGAAVVVDLAAGTGRAGLARGPGDVLEGKELDPLCGHPDLTGPVVEGDLVLLPDRHPQPVPVQTVAALLAAACQQAPGVGDGPLLEVVAEGEVAVHLEEGAVARRDTDVVDVIGADALLHRGGPGPGGLLGAQDVGDEGHHAGHGEQDGGLGRHQGDRGPDLVLVRGEVVQPAAADLGCAHGVLILFEVCPGTAALGPGAGRVDGVVWPTGRPGTRRRRWSQSPAGAEPVELLRGERTPTPGRPEPLMGPGRPGVRWA